MRKAPSKFEDIATEIAQVEAMRERVRLKAFDMLESQAGMLANMVLLTKGDRLRAAQWMCMRQRLLDGRSAYEALAEGDMERVWDLVAGTDEGL